MAVTTNGNTITFTGAGTSGNIPWSGGWATVQSNSVGQALESNANYNVASIVMRHSANNGVWFVPVQGDGTTAGSPTAVTITGYCDINVWIGAGLVNFTCTGTPSGSGVAICVSRGVIGVPMPNVNQNP